MGPPFTKGMGLQGWGSGNWWEPLTSSPLFAAGLGGSPRLVDIGGVPYLIPVVDRSKLYNLTEMAVLAELPGAFLLGAGAGSSRVAGVNCEVSEVHAAMLACLDLFCAP